MKFETLHSLIFEQNESEDIADFFNLKSRGMCACTHVE